MAAPVLRDSHAAAGRARLAYHHTRDPRYLRFMVDHVLGYMKAYPIEEFVGKSSNTGWTDHTTVAKPWYWCMIPERFWDLSDTLTLIRSAPEMSDEELLTILHRLYQECGYLETQIQAWVDRRHNGGCAMIRGFVMACTILQDFPQSQQWLDFNAELAAQYTQAAVLPRRHVRGADDRVFAGHVPDDAAHGLCAARPAGDGGPEAARRRDDHLPGGAQRPHGYRSLVR